MSYDYIDTDLANQDNLTRISSNSSRLGFKGSEDLGGGLKAVWQWENQITADTNAAAPTNRNTFLGLAGGFGTALLGTHDTPYKLGTGSLDVFGDTMADYNTIIGNVQGVNRFDLRGSNVIAYISPDFSGFHGAIARVNANEAGNLGAANPDAWSATGIYKNGPLFASLSWEKHENLGDATGTKLTGTKLGLGYTAGDAKVGFIYEQLDDNGANSVNDRNAWVLNGAYAMGPITLKAAYGHAGDGNSAADTKASNIVLGADYALSKRTKAYALYAKTSNKSGATYGVGGAGAGGIYNAAVADNDPSVISIGMEHRF